METQSHISREMEEIQDYLMMDVSIDKIKEKINFCIYCISQPEQKHLLFEIFLDNIFSYSLFFEDQEQEEMAILEGEAMARMDVDLRDDMVSYVITEN